MSKNTIKTDRVIETYLDSSSNFATANRVLEFIEERIDEDHIENAKKRLVNSISFKENAFNLIVHSPSEEFKPYPYRETFENMDMMMTNQLIIVATSVSIKDDTIPMLRANYGVPIMPSLFGLDYRIVSNNLPWVNHVDNIDDIKRIIDNGIPDLTNGLGEKIDLTHEYYKEKLKKYPKSNKLINLYHPDMQGPIDIAHLIWGNEFYYAIYDYPELVHELMDLVTKTYIKYMKHIKSSIDDEYQDCCYHWNTLYKGKIVLRNDTAINFSNESYEEFIKPYDEQILKEFNGGSIHYCGRGDHLISSMLETKELKGRNFGQPPNMEFGISFLNEIYDKFKNLNIPVLGYYLNKDEIEKVMKSRYKTGVTYNTVANNINDAKKLYHDAKKWYKYKKEV